MDEIRLTKRIQIVIVVLAIACVATVAFFALKGCEIEKPDQMADGSVIMPHGLLQKATGLPDVRVLETGNQYGVPGLADIIGEIDDTSLQYNCPIAVFNGGFITDDSAHMVEFLEIKVMKLDSLGNTTFAWEDYKPSSFQRTDEYAFISECLPGLQCVESFTHDTIYVNQQDVYDNRIKLNGKGDYVIEVTPNSLGLWKECPSCGNDHYFFAFHYEQITQNGFFVWKATRKDSLLTNAIKSRLKTFK